jgi:hypothetical protein
MVRIQFAFQNRVWQLQCMLMLQTDFWLLCGRLRRSQHSQSLLRCLIGQSGGTPDCPVNFSERAPRKPESGQFAECSARAPDSVWCVTCCSTIFLQSFRIPQCHFLCMFMWTLCTCEKYPLGKLVSPYGLWWTSNTKIDYRKCWGHFPFN